MASLFASFFDASGGNIGYSALLTETAQSFNSLQNQNLVKAGFYLSISNAPTGNISCKLYAHSGTYGTSSVPTGAALATSTNTIDITTLTAVRTYQEFSFTPIALSATTYYCIAVAYSGSSGSNTLNVFTKFNPAVGHSGNFSQLQSGAWSTDTRDLAFNLFNDNSVPGNYGHFIRTGDSMSRSEVAN